MANYTSVIASNICDAAGNKLAAGTVSFQATDAGNQPINFQVGGGGQVVTTPATATITNGVIAGGFQVADSANTSPAGVLYRITITDTTLNRAVVTYSLVTVTGATFNLDNYSQPGAALLSPVGSSVNGPLTVNGNLNVTGTLQWSGAGASVIVGNPTGAQSVIGDFPLTVGGSLSAKRLLQNTTATNDKYAAEFANSGSYVRAQVRIGQPNVETGMMLNSSGITNATISIGSVPDLTCGSGWRATDVGATDWHMGGGGLQLQEWHGDGGLTPGGCFSPSLRMVLSGNQLQLNNGTSSVPSYTWLAESPNPGTGFFRTSDPGLGLSVSNGVYSSPSGVPQLLFLNGKIQPWTDNALHLGDTTHRLIDVYTSTVVCGTTGNITCIQSDGSNNMFIGNGNAQSVTVQTAAGRAFAATNSSFLFGAGGTTNQNDVMQIVGSSAAGFGPTVQLRRNGVAKFQFGTQSAILGDNSDNTLLYSNSNNVDIYPSGTKVASFSTTGITMNGAVSIVLGSVAFASLGTPANGSIIYCSDCTVANPCAGGGTGALAKRLNGAWVCN